MYSIYRYVASYVRIYIYMSFIDKSTINPTVIGVLNFAKSRAPCGRTGQLTPNGFVQAGELYSFIQEYPEWDL